MHAAVTQILQQRDVLSCVCNRITIAKSLTISRSSACANFVPRLGADVFTDSVQDSRRNTVKWV